MKKLYLLLSVSLTLFMISACQSERVWSRIDEHDLEHTDGEPEIIDKRLFENQLPPEQENPFFSDFDNNSRNYDNANLSGRNESGENSDETKTKNETNIDSEKITGYLRDILAAITSPENANENKSSPVEESNYIPPEQLPLIDEPTVYDESDFASSNEAASPSMSTPTMERQSYVQDAWPRPGSEAWKTAQAGTKNPVETLKENIGDEQKSTSDTSPAEHDNFSADEDKNLVADKDGAELENTQTVYADFEQADETELAMPEKEDFVAQITAPSGTAQETDEQAQQMDVEAQTSDVSAQTNEITQNENIAQAQPATQAQQNGDGLIQYQQIMPDAATSAQTNEIIQNENVAQAQPATRAQQTDDGLIQYQQIENSQQTQPASPSQPMRQPAAQSPVPVQQAAIQAQTQQTPVTTPQPPAQQAVRQNQQAATTQTAQQREPAQQQNIQQAAPVMSQQVSPATDQMSYEYIPETGISQTETEMRHISPSRSVTLDLGAYLDVNYPGNGWIYLGESEGANYLQFLGRKLGQADTSFTLRAKAHGNTLLHFYKNDLLTGSYIDDWLEVTVTDKQVANSSIHITAPSYASAVPPRPTRPQTNETQTYVATVQQTAATTNTQQENIPQSTNISPSEKPSESIGRTVIQTTTNAPQPENAQRQNQTDVPQATVAEAQAIESMPSDTNALLERARQLYNSGNHADALNILHQFFDTAKDKIDEGLFLQGQILEANSSVRDIRGAVDSYQILMNNWPDSNLWQDAQRRYIYLRRFYINIH